MFRALLRARLCRGKEGLHRAPTFVRQFGGYTHILLLFLSSTHYCPLFHPLLSEIYPLLTTLRPSKGGLKRQSLLQTWCGSAPRRGPSVNGYDAWRLDPADPGARSLQLLLQIWCGSAPRRGPSANGYDAWRLDPADPGARSLQLLLQTWRGSAPRRGPSANGYDAWRFGSCGPGRKILAAAAADLVWVCTPPRTIRKWLRRLAFWILRARAQDPCSCCLIFRTKVDEKVDNSGWRIKIVAECGYTHQIVGQKWVPGGALLSRGRVWPVDVPETSCKSMPTL